MAMLTEALLRKLCPRASADFISAFTSPEAAQIFTDYGIDADPRIMAAFMANVCEETGGGTIVRESSAYRASTLMRIFPSRYRVGAKGPDGRPIGDRDGDGISDLAEYHAAHPEQIFNYNYGFRLGNEDDGVNDDDGFRYRGGGPLQSTGKANYKYLEAKTGIPFGSKPELIENPAYWAKVAAVTWTQHQSAGNLNPIALQGNFEGCCRGINTGNCFSSPKIVVNGLAERIAWFKKWTAALNAAPLALSSPPQFGVKSPAVKPIQQRLNELHYADGKLVVDGAFGSRTRSALMDFQLENGLTANGCATPDVMAKLMSADARPFPAPAAAALGVAGLRAAGDPEIKQADRDRAAAVTLAAAGTASAVQQSGILDLAQGLSKDLTAWQGAFTGLIAVVKFGCANILPIGCLIGAIFLYRRFGAVIWQKVGKWTKPVGTGVKIKPEAV